MKKTVIIPILVAACLQMASCEESDETVLFRTDVPHSVSEFNEYFYHSGHADALQQYDGDTLTIYGWLWQNDGSVHDYDYTQPQEWVRLVDDNMDNLPYHGRESALRLHFDAPRSFSEEESHQMYQVTGTLHSFELPAMESTSYRGYLDVIEFIPNHNK